MFRKSLALLVSTSMLSACYSFRGPPPVLDRGNVVHADVSQPRSGYLYERFRRATLVASGCREEPALPRVSEPRDAAPLAQFCDPRSMTTEAREAAMEEFMQAAYALIYADCGAYFAHMSRNQGRTRIARDSIAPISSLITGILSVVRFENPAAEQDASTILAVATGAGTSALDVYDQHFLFGADNIDVVRQLVMRALAAHALASFVRKTNRFDQATVHIEDNQAICRPSHILTLARQAIAAGTIEARSSLRPPGQESGDKADTAETAAAESGTGQQPASRAIESISVSAAPRQ